MNHSLELEASALGRNCEAGLIQPVARPCASNPGKVSILIVDDTRENLVAFQSMLAPLGENVVLARSGREALHRLNSQEFALILLDVNMPDLDGFETGALIRQRQSSQGTPIIFVGAASADPAQAARAYSLGAVDCLSGPIAPEALRSKVAVLVDLQKQSQELRAEAERLRQLSEEQQGRLRDAAQCLDVQTRRNRFFNLSAELLGIADLEGKLFQLNPAWERVLGISLEKILNRSGLEFVHPDDLPVFRENLKSLQQSDSTASFELRCACKDGTFRWLNVTAVSRVADGDLFVFAHDVTARKWAEEQVRQLNVVLTNRAAELETTNSELQRQMAVRQQMENALKESNAELEAFAYSVSHDLRAPLRGMHGFAQALLEDYAEELSPGAGEYAQRIVSAATRLDTLIQDLLLYSRMSHCALRLEPVNLDRTVSEALLHLEPLLAEGKITVTRQQPLTWVLAHGPTLVQVLCNLLSNAVKFVAPGVRPRVHIGMDKTPEVARLWIEDNGIGVAPEHHSRIFRVFERLHGVEAYPGTGIGLAIVRKGVERMRGRLGVHSAPQQGSRFWLELPLASGASVDSNVQ